MKKLRTYYERELGAQLGFNQEFAARFPAQGGRLGMVDGANGDPHIERFIQANALSNARIAKLIDESDGKLTEALLSVNYPQYVRPLPACAVVCADTDGSAETMTGATTIPAGATMSARTPDGEPCKFRAAFALQLTPLRPGKLAYQASFQPPPTMRRPAAATSALSIEIESKAATVGLHRIELDYWRLYIDADPSLCALIRDVLFMHVACAYLELDGNWVALDTVPLKPVGFAPEQMLLPAPASAHPAYQLLTEYFGYGEKFNFFDVDWPVLARQVRAPCQRLTLHLGLTGIAAASDIARRLAALTGKHFRPGCAPVINLFKRSACPIELNHIATDYPLMPDAHPVAGYDIYSVDKVCAIQDGPNGQVLTEFRPYYAMRHGEGDGERGRYYLVRRDPLKALSDPGHDLRIALVDLDLDPLAMADTCVSIELTCTNRDLPSRLRPGAPGGDLALEQAGDVFPLRLLRKPGRQHRFSVDAHWRLIAHLSLNYCSLAQGGLNYLKEMLALYDITQSPVAQRQIAGITALAHRQARAWLRDGGRSALVNGIEVRLTLDEDAFAGSGMHVFVQVLDHFFGLYVHLNSFTQLTVLSHANGRELIRCKPRNGALQLV